VEPICGSLTLWNGRDELHLALFLDFVSESELRPLLDVLRELELGLLECFEVELQW
jgi:hypothetical protein